MAKPSLPQGTRDFSAETVHKRNFILNTIRTVFELYGYQPLETPAMENLDTLMGKYGDEGDKLIFKVLNNGLNDPKNEEKARSGFAKLMEGKNTVELTERALKYDLTIPFARYIAMNHGQLTFPFRRYQVQPVWRADRPQKGRYREFTQCDADVVGSTSLVNEVELAYIYSESLKRLGLKDSMIKINSRKILVALAEKAGGVEKLIDITVAIDKLDKIGIDKVKIELVQKGLSDPDIEVIIKYLDIQGSNTEKLQAIKEMFGDSAKDGLHELEFVCRNCPDLNIEVDLTLARGLNYYTGIIFEVKGPDTVKMGSIGGGGRYDDLTGLFGVPNIPGVGISFGVDRIYDVMDELKLFPDDLSSGVKALFFNLGEKEAATAFQLMQTLRKSGISAELYHETTKMDKQFRYAEKKNINNVVIIGTEELEKKTCTVKNLSTGEQTSISMDKLSSLFQNK